MLVNIVNRTDDIISIDSLALRIVPRGIRTIALDDDSLPKKISDELTNFRNAGHILFTTEEDPEFDDSLEAPVIDMLVTGSGGGRVRMDNAPDITGGGVTQTVGFLTVDAAGRPIQAKMQFAVFTDVGVSIPYLGASLHTPTEGVIWDGAGSPALKVETDSNGRFTCTLTAPGPGIGNTYLSCDTSFGSFALACSEVDIVNFS